MGVGEERGKGRRERISGEEERETGERREEGREGGRWEV